jgi:capsular exopolysaccharide synthesis family protein
MTPERNDHTGIEAVHAASTEAVTNLLQVAWQRKSLVALGAVAGFVLGSLYYTQLPPSYKTTAQVLVIKNQPDSLGASSPGIDARLPIYEDYLATHLTIVKSDELIMRALQKPEMKALPTLQLPADSTRDPRDIVTKALIVKRDNKDASGTYNNVLNLSLLWPEREEGIVILQAILDSYRKFLDEAYKTSTEETLELVIRERDGVKKDLAEKEKEYLDFRQNSPLLLRKGKEGTTLTQDRLVIIERRRAALALRKVEIEAHKRSLEDGIKEKIGAATLIAMIANWADKPPEAGTPTKTVAASPDSQLLALLQREKAYLENYGPNHPKVLEVRSEIESVLRSTTGPRINWANLLEESGKKDPAALMKLVGAYLQSLQLDLKGIAAEEEDLTAEFKAFYKEAKELAAFEIQDESAADDIVRTKKYLDAIVKRVNEASFTKEFRGYEIRVISPPRSWPAGPSIVLILMASGFLGTLGGFGLAYLGHISDRSFRSPEEIRRRLGVPVAGYVPFINIEEATEVVSTSGSSLDPVLISHHQSQSREAEMIRRIRTSLYFNTRSKGHNVVQITSPQMGDGKSTLAANLAICIAQSGKKVVIIDADFRRPRQHKLFGLTSTVGLASVIKDSVEINDAVHAVEVQNLSVIPCGPIPTNPAELLNSPRFKEVVDLLRERYDFVIVDTPPLLVVSDPCIVTPTVDGVLMTIRASKNGRPDAERAKEILDTLSATCLGVVVNGMDSEGGYGYYYGSYYKYGYYYGYYADKYESETPAETNGTPDANGSPPDSSDRASSGKKSAKKRRTAATTIWGKLFKGR